MKNARFLYWFNNEFSKITLKPGQSLSWENYATNEEGYSHRYVTLKYDKDEQNIYEYSGTNSTDCDGRFSTEKAMVCSLDKLHGYTNFYGTKIPDWNEVKSSQRDYSAEAMGY